MRLDRSISFVNQRGVLPASGSGVPNTNCIGLNSGQNKAPVATELGGIHRTSGVPELNQFWTLPKH